MDPFKPFEWTLAANATGYFLQVGTTPGAADIYAEGELLPTVTRRVVWGLMPGIRYYARLLINESNSWSSVDIQFQTVAPTMPAAPSPSALNALVQQLTAQVRGMTQGQTNLPTTGTPLARQVAERGQTYADCIDYSNTLIELLAANRIFSRRVSMSLVGNTWIGHTVVEYWDPFRQHWTVADSTFGLVYFDDLLQQGQSANELSLLVQSETFAAIKPKFVTSLGDSYMRAYYLDPVTLYLNVAKQGQRLRDAVAHSPLQFLISATPGTHGYYLFQFPDSSGSMTLNDPPGSFAYEIGHVDLSGADGTQWSRAITLNDGWTIFSVSPAVQTYTFRRVLF